MVSSQFKFLNPKNEIKNFHYSMTSTRGVHSYYHVDLGLGVSDWTKSDFTSILVYL